MFNKDIIFAYKLHFSGAINFVNCSGEIVVCLFFSLSIKIEDFSLFF